MRKSWLVGLSVIAVAMSSAAMADESKDCLGHKDGAVRIKGCSALIQRDPRNAIAYHNRGLAYAAKDDLDRAVADYTKAIELNPNYGPAFDGRGRVLARQGDYPRALADVTRASELKAKGVSKENAIATASVKAQPPPMSPPKAKAATQPEGATLVETVPGGHWPGWALRNMARH